jgi:hypothetical protein
MTDDTDEQLCERMTKVARSRLIEQLTLTNWEKSFLLECPGKWVRFGTLTFKQRKAAREVLLKIECEVERRKLAWKWFDEAKGARR